MAENTCCEHVSWSCRIDVRDTVVYVSCMIGLEGLIMGSIKFPNAITTCSKRRASMWTNGREGEGVVPGGHYRM